MQRIIQTDSELSEEDIQKVLSKQYKKIKSENDSTDKVVINMFKTEFNEFIENFEKVKLK